MENRNEASIKKLIKDTVEKNSANLTPAEIKQQEAVLQGIYLEGKKPYEAMNISKDAIEFFYLNAFNLYNSGKYDAAIKIFFLLDMFDPTDSRFNYGIAACHHMEKRYDDAIFVYNKCLFQSPLNPMVYYHLADCYIKTNRKREALVMLGVCIKNIENDEMNSALKTRAEQAYNNLTREIEDETNEPVESKRE